MGMVSCVSEYVKENRKEAEELLMRLGKIPAPSRQEEQRAQFCRQWFLDQGFQDVSVDEAKNVICRLNWDSEKPAAVFMAHTDVVFDDTEELPMTREGNILWAPGIGDDTSNLVNLMMAARYLVRNPQVLSRPVLIVANSCEEGLGNLKGCRRIFDDFGDRIGEFYSFDGYMGQCTSVPVGSSRYRITVRAEGGHSYLDFGKENAICTAAELIQKLYRISAPSEEKTTYNVGRIEGGSMVNSIAQEASMLYEYRSASQKCMAEMKEKLEQVLKDFSQAGHQIECELLGERPGRGEMDLKALQRWTDSNTAVIRQFYQGEMDFRAFSTDANIPLSRGILANTVGTIQGAAAHTREEWVDLESLPAGMSIALGLMLKAAQAEG